MINDLCNNMPTLEIIQWPAKLHFVQTKFKYCQGKSAAMPVQPLEQV
jgi:hypothetical protein